METFPLSRGLLLLIVAAVVVAAEPPASRRQEAEEFHRRAQERTGVLVPLYVYPSDVDKNPAYQRLIEAKRRHRTVPVWVIVNPASGPGERVDDNYTKAIDRLRGAGCVVLGYVTTSYGKRTREDVRKDIDRWRTLYPRAQGIFFDEMTYEDTEAGAKHQAALNEDARAAGCWPTVANPGADTPRRYFDARAADVILVHEGEAFPKEDRLRGNAANGYADHPPFTRGVLMHSQPKFDKDALRTASRHVGWVYVTEGVFRPGDPKFANPWDRLSKHLEETFEVLAEK